MKHLANFIIKPIVSEKSYAEAKAANRYTFMVARGANKTDIKNAVEKMFGVNVKNVFTANIKGTKIRNTKIGRQTIDLSYKKARVLLAKGQSIAIFAESTDEAKKETKKETKKESKKE